METNINKTEPQDGGEWQEVKYNNNDMPPMGCIFFFLAVVALAVYVFWQAFNDKV